MIFPSRRPRGSLWYKNALSCTVTFDVDVTMAPFLAELELEDQMRVLFTEGPSGLLSRKDTALHALQSMVCRCSGWEVGGRKISFPPPFPE